MRDNWLIDWLLRAKERGGSKKDGVGRSQRKDGGLGKCNCAGLSGHCPKSLWVPVSIHFHVVDSSAHKRNLSSSHFFKIAGKPLLYGNSSCVLELLCIKIQWVRPQNPFSLPKIGPHSLSFPTVSPNTTSLTTLENFSKL